MSLKNKLVDNKPREIAGPRTASRYNFQENASLWLLLEIHNKSQDYLIAFDYHDDVLILDESEPQVLSFYQIKGKEGVWKLGDLLKSQGNGYSIFGKLYYCKTVLSETTELNFLSNARYDIPLKNNQSGASKSTIHLIDLPFKEREKIRTKLKGEYPSHNPVEFHDLAFLKVLDISLKDSSAHMKGKLVSC
ncbi:MAG: dsDNA nuclease domain-containing protein [Bacteroidia bacterium]